MGLAFVSFGLLLAGGLLLWIPDAGVSPGTANSELGSAFLGGAVVSLAVFLTGQQGQLEEAQRALAQSLMARFFEPQFMDEMAATAAFLGNPPSSLDALPLDERQQMLGPLNYFERIGAAYVAKEASRAILYRELLQVAPQLWDQANALVTWLRHHRADADVYANWEMMVVDFRRKSTRRRPRTYEPTS
jgi:hypothetical protein